MIVIGVTGSIGMGKSTTAKMLSTEYGAPLYDADTVVADLIGPKGAAVQKVADIFPDSYNPKTEQIDRSVLAKIVFADAEKRRALENILHPMVRAAQKKFLEQNVRSQYVVLDIPLLFETDGDKNCDYTICVSAPAHIQKQRVLARGMSLEAFEARLSSQMPDVEKQRRADFVIQTGISFSDTLKQLKKIMRKVGQKPKGG
jgi:dephospho-CoA kinase